MVLSTVGISILLNGLEKTEQEWRERLSAAANHPELSPELADKVNELTQRVLDRMQNSSVHENRKRCAELNGLYGIYDNNLAAASKDTHFLIATDTALGKASANILQEFLRANHNYTHKKQGNLPIGHFRVSQATRVSCTYEAGKLHLRRFGREEEVNANP